LKLKKGFFINEFKTKRKKEIKNGIKPDFEFNDLKPLADLLFKGKND